MPQHNRIMRLHRPYFMRGWTDPKYAESTNAAFESAAAICKTIGEDIHVDDGNLEHVWWLWAYSLSAVFIICGESLDPAWREHSLTSRWGLQQLYCERKNEERRPRRRSCAGCCCWLELSTRGERKATLLRPCGKSRSKHARCLTRSRARATLKHYSTPHLLPLPPSSSRSLRWSNLRRRQQRQLLHNKPSRYLHRIERGALDQRAPRMVTRSLGRYRPYSV